MTAEQIEALRRGYVTLASVQARRYYGDRSLSPDERQAIIAALPLMEEHGLERQRLANKRALLAELANMAARQVDG